MDHSEQRQQQPQPQPGVDIRPGSGPMSYPMPAGTAFDQAQHLQQQQQLQIFWANQIEEMKQPSLDFKSTGLPLTRIKRIMKGGENVCMISADAPVIFAKACEMFIQDLTLRSLMHMEENKSHTLLKNDIFAAISRTDVFDFLLDIIPEEEMEEVDASPPYYYVPPQNQPSLP